MAVKPKGIESMHDLFLDLLREIYHVESRTLEVMPALIGAASESTLRNVLTSHFVETESHIDRLRQIFRSFGEEIKGTACPAMDGIFEEAGRAVERIADAEVRDAALAASAQIIEHFEIARYGTLVAWATELGWPDCVGLLGQTLEEENTADLKLTQIAEGRLNRLAA